MNVICICSDTFRFDNLSCHGAEHVKTPNIDAFAKKAVSFANCMCSSFPTLPHRIDTFTGHVGFPHFGWGPMPTDVPTMAGILGDNGYRTQIIFDPPNLQMNNYWITRGFDASHAVHGQEGEVTFLHCNDPIKQHLPEEKIRTEIKIMGSYLADIHPWINWERKTEFDYHCAKTAMEASKWLDLNYKAENMFLWVDIFDPHEPWDPPEYFVKRFDPDYDGLPMADPNYGLATAYTDAELKNMKAHYRAEVTFVDKWIGFLLKKIEDVGWMDNTIILFTSDHGFQIGEHGHVGKGDRKKPDDYLWWPMYSQLKHVPLMVYVPGVTNGGVCDAMVQPYDILPTMLDLLGIETDLNFEGRSFKKQLYNTDVDFGRKYSISSCYVNAGSKVTPSVTSKDWSYMAIGADGINAELYDRHKDPAEENNVIAEHPEVAAEMKKALEDFLVGHGVSKDAYLKLGKK